MPVALTKKQTVVEAAPLPDDPLVAAVEFKRQSQAALTAKLEALQRARDGITSAEVHLEECRGAIAKAKESDVRAASTNLDKGVHPATPWHLSNALSSVGRAEAVLEVAGAAHIRKREEVKVVEDNHAEAENNIRVCIKQKTKPEVIRQMDELRQARRRAAILTRSIAEYLNDDPRLAPHFHDAMRGFRAAEERKAVFADIRDEAARLSSGTPNEDFEAGLEMAKAVKAALLELQHNPAAALPKV